MLPGAKSFRLIFACPFQATWLQKKCFINSGKELMKKILSFCLILTALQWTGPNLSAQRKKKVGSQRSSGVTIDYAASLGPTNPIERLQKIYVNEKVRLLLPPLFDIVRLSGNEYISEGSTLDLSYKEKVVKVLSIDGYGQKAAPRENALGETLPDTEDERPIDIVVQCENGITARSRISQDAINTLISLPVEEEQRRNAAISAEVKAALGKVVYATGATHLYDTKATMEDILSDKYRLLNIPLLVPIRIVDIKMVDDDFGGKLPVFKLEMPDQTEALGVNRVYSPRTVGRADSFNNMVEPEFEVAIPKSLTPHEIDAIRKRTLFRGMSSIAAEYIYGAPEHDNDYGIGGEQLVYGCDRCKARIYIYINTNGIVTNWQFTD